MYVRVCQDRVMSGPATTEVGVSATMPSYVSVRAVFKEHAVNTVSPALWLINVDDDDDDDDDVEGHWY